VKQKEESTKHAAHYMQPKEALPMSNINIVKQRSLKEYPT